MKELSTQVSKLLKIITADPIPESPLQKTAPVVVSDAKVRDAVSEKDLVMLVKPDILHR